MPSKIALPLLALVLVPAQAVAQTTPAPQGPASVGTSSSRLSLPSLLFSLPLLLLGLYLLFLGRRFVRLTCSLTLACVFALAAWAGTVNLVSQNGLPGRGSTEWQRDLSVWGVVAGCWILGAVLGSLPRYGTLCGWSFLGCLGGLSLGFMIQLLSSDLTVHNNAARWTLIGFLLVLGLVSVVVSKVVGVILCTSLAGSFLLMLGVDLLVNANRGMSMGLAKLIDHNPRHRAALASWDPPTSTIAFAAASWILACIGVLFQLLVFRRRGAFLPESIVRATPFTSVLAPVVASKTDEKFTGSEPGPNGQRQRESGLTDAPEGWRYSRQDSATPGDGNSSTAEMAELGTAALAGTRARKATTPGPAPGEVPPSESGLSAIAEQTERSRTDSAVDPGVVAAMNGSPVNSLYNRTYPLSFDPNTPTSSSALDSDRRGERYPRGRSRQPGDPVGWYHDPNLPATPPLTMFSESTIMPDDSASQVGWRRAQQEAQANYFANGPTPGAVGTYARTERELSDEDRSASPGVAVPIAAGGLRVANPTPTASPAHPSPSSPTAAPPPFSASPVDATSPGRGSPSSQDSSRVVSQVGKPGRVFWMLGNMVRRGGSKKSHKRSGSGSQPQSPVLKDAPAAVPFPQPVEEAETEQEMLQPPRPAARRNRQSTDYSGASPSARGVLSRLGHTFGRSHSQTALGSSTMMSQPTGPMAPFLRPEDQPPMPPTPAMRDDEDRWRSSAQHV